jgi:hypothetical protein
MESILTFGYGYPQAMFGRVQAVKLSISNVKKNHICKWQLLPFQVFIIEEMASGQCFF